MYSTRGRRRTVTDAQVNAILEWYRSRKTIRQFALEMNLPKSTVEYVISIGGRYKQPSPELFDSYRDVYRNKIKKLHASGWL